MISQIEFLPNEIFIEIFEYLNAQDLFRALYNLNFRFNDLIHSMKNISLTISTNNKNETDSFQLFSSYISTLTIDSKIDVSLDSFTNIRRLNLLHITDRTWAQFENTDILPLLEHLSIIYRVNQTIVPCLHQKIFSNGFPNLISCCLFSLGIIKTAEGWTQSPSLRILKVRIIDLMVYKAILLACPNLHFLQLRMPNIDVTSLHIEPHMNLKRMVLKIPYNTYPQTDDVISDLLASTPNLEQFSLYRLIWDSNNTSSLVDYDWLAAIIDFRLPLLRRFTFYLYFSILKESEGSNMKNVFNQIEEHFKRVHNNRYQSRLIIPQI